MKAILKSSLLILFTLSIIGFSSCKKSEDEVVTGNRVGNLVPDFSLQNQRGEFVSVSDFRGKFVIVEFCASWCGFCKAEFPELNQIYSEFEDKGLEIISLSIDQNKTEWLKMIEDYNITYVCVNDPSGFDARVVDLYGVETIPRMYLIDKKGVILQISTKADAIRETLRKRL